ncbi:ABC transporter [Marinobacter daepoensis]|uniref:ABC transporter n=1 Tax=Marinobacter daepoensis TaxID=262077 RepID=A0ABS3BGJ1_9GAMM|nr:ABC transporter [Marinobacter daepoensis]MBN7770425.1 ABC transporter [Marinobacter daepoensis]MBY6033957.1 ABC transporter [Marinobacter daepoensis]MBY6079871.1 ABC transporter [Marinobacter daepoensis]
MNAYEWLILPAVGSAMLCLLLVPLGYQVIARGVIFADLAIAQWASLGTLAGLALLPAYALAGAPLSSLIFALLASGVVHLIFRRLGDAKEAWIGLLYVVGASFAVLLVSGDPHGAQALQRAASGDLLWAGRPVVVATAMLATLVWMLGRWRSAWMSGVAFLPVFAVAVTYSVSLAGIYVVFATLIITPLILGACLGERPALAVCCAIAGHLAAIGCSVVWDVPAGPTIVVVTLAMALIWFLALRGLAAQNLRALRAKSGGSQ